MTTTKKIKQSATAAKASTAHQKPVETSQTQKLIVTSQKHAVKKSTGAKVFDNGTDVSDVSRAPFPQANTGTPAIAPDDEAITDTFGALITIGENGNVSVNQIAIAAKFLHDFQIRFDEAAGQFRRYNSDTGVWDALNDAPAKLLLGSLLKRVAEENEAEKLIAMRTHSLLGSILGLARGHAVMPRPRADGSPLIHVANGIVDVSGKEPKLGDFDQDQFSTKACAIAYNPEAKCDRFLEELVTPALPDAEDGRPHDPRLRRPSP
jgi:hypothetical protein